MGDRAPFVTLAEETVDLGASDIRRHSIRKDPPFDQAYLYTTLLLEHARSKTLLINDPRGLRDANEKLYALNFPQFTAAHAGHGRTATRSSSSRPRSGARRSSSRSTARAASACSRCRPATRMRAPSSTCSPLEGTTAGDGAGVPAGGARRATSASCCSTASRSARSCACRAPTTCAPTSTSAAAWCRPSSPPGELAMVQRHGAASARRRSRLRRPRRHRRATHRGERHEPHRHPAACAIHRYPPGRKAHRVDRSPDDALKTWPCPEQRAGSAYGAKRGVVRVPGVCCEAPNAEPSRPGYEPGDDSATQPRALP